MSVNEHVAICPVFNFEIDDDLVHSEFTIHKRLTKEVLENEYNILFRHMDELEQIYWENYPIFVKRISNPTNGIDVDFAQMQGFLNSLLNIIILFTPWATQPLAIGPFHLKEIRNGSLVGGFSGGYVPTNLTSIGPMWEKINLNRTDFSNFNDFFNMTYPELQDYTNNKVQNRAIIANYWLYKSRENYAPYDKLIFLVTALEGLVSQHEDELSYRISHRVATLLGTNESEKLSIFLSIRQLYDLRSKIVHGTPKKEVKMYETWYLQEIVRALILKFISFYKNDESNESKLLTSIDNAVYDPILRNELIEKGNRVFRERSNIVLHESNI